MQHGRSDPRTTLEQRTLRRAPLLLLALAACREAPPGLLPDSEMAYLFEEVSEEAGIHTRGNSWSIAWGDFDGDGWPDLYSNNHGDTPQLYVNDRAGGFRLHEPEAGLREAWRRRDAHGATWADFDGDGDQDLLEMQGAARGKGELPNLLYASESGERTLAEDAAGLSYARGRGRASLWLDWELDGDLDVLLCNARSKEAPTALFPRQLDGFVRAELELPALDTDFAQTVGFAGPESRHLVMHDPAFEKAVWDLASGRPWKSAQELGIPYSPSAQDFAIADFDGDLDPDIFLVIGTRLSDARLVDERHLRAWFLVQGYVRGLSFASEGPLRFDPAPAQKNWWHAGNVFLGEQGEHPQELPFTLSCEQAAGRLVAEELPREGRGLHVGFDPDSRRWSVFVRGETYQHLSLEIESATPIGGLEAHGFRFGGVTQADRYLLFDGERLVDHARRAGVEGPTLASNVAAGDFDNDMDVDLFVVCTASVDNSEDVLYENLGDGTFGRVPGEGGAAGTRAGLGDAVAVADYDRDGFLDLAISNGKAVGPPTEGPLQLFRNRGNRNHWLEVDLVATESNPEAVGAQVHVRAGGRTQVRFRGVQTHRGAQDFRRLHFGLGENQSVEELSVYWPNGARSTLRDLAADQILEIVE